MRVDLPAPLSPTRPTTSLEQRSRETSSRARKPPNVLRDAFTLTRGVRVVGLSSAPPFKDPLRASESTDATQRNGHDQQRSREEILGEDGCADHGEAVVPNGDCQDADQRAQDMELPLLKRSRAEKGRGEGGQHEAVAGCHLSRSEVGRHQYAPNRGAGARAGECDNATAVDCDSRASRGLFALTPMALICCPCTVRFRMTQSMVSTAAMISDQVRHAPEPADGDIGVFAGVGRAAEEFRLSRHSSFRRQGCRCRGWR